MPKRKYIVGYELPYTHVVRMAVEADTAAEAESNAKTICEKSDPWDDLTDTPLLIDDYVEEDGVLEYRVIEEVESFPNPEGSVMWLRSEQLARQACQQLVEAYRKAGGGSSVDWSDVDRALYTACEALEINPSTLDESELDDEG